MLIIDKITPKWIYFLPVRHHHRCYLTYKTVVDRHSLSFSYIGMKIILCVIVVV